MYLVIETIHLKILYYTTVEEKIKPINMIPLPHNPIKDILAVISITAIATGAFIKYVQYYEKKYGSGNKRDRK